MMSFVFGSILTLAGLSILCNAIFGFHIPVFKLLLAAFLIGLGIKILFFPRTLSHPFTACHKEEKKGDNYEVAFTSSTIDLRYLNDLTAPKTISICSNFAHVTVFLPLDVPLRVKADTAFGTVDLPGYQMSSEYVNLHGASEPVLTVYINSKFSSVVVKA